MFYVFSYYPSGIIFCFESLNESKQEEVLEKFNSSKCLSTVDAENIWEACFKPKRTQLNFLDDMPDIYLGKWNDLSEADYSGRICFYINTEPLLDSRLADFVEYSRRSCPKATLHVMTNGIKLTNELGKRLLKNGLDLLEINNYSHDGLVRGNVKNFMSDVAPL